MPSANEPHIKKSSCAYCGDAPVSHALSFVESFFAVTLDNYAKKFLKYAPDFLKKFADIIPEFLFRSFVFLKLAKFSSDISKAKSFRSKIVWKEAQKRGIEMEQVIFLKKPLDFYRAKLKIKGKQKYIYFESLPLRYEAGMDKNWDDKVFLKKEFEKHGIPVPAYFELSLFSRAKDRAFFALSKPLIVKPRVGSRGRHTATNISNLADFHEAVKISAKICPYLIVEEHITGNVCRATFVGGELAGFYIGHAPTLVGDGHRTIKELIEDLDRQRPERVEPIRIQEELHSHIARAGFSMPDVLPAGVSLSLSHRIGRLFGGRTKEMIGELHPSFMPVLQKAAKTTGLSVAGFDCIIPDPTKDEATQKWGIIECNTLPFIDLHYYALEGKPKNIAGMIWDMWK